MVGKYYHASARGGLAFHSFIHSVQWNTASSAAANSRGLPQQAHRPLADKPRDAPPYHTSKCRYHRWEIQIAIRFKSRLNHCRRFDLTARRFDLNARDSIGIRYEIHGDLIWNCDESEIAVQGKTEYQNNWSSAVSDGAQCKMHSEHAWCGNLTDLLLVTVLSDVKCLKEWRYFVSVLVKSGDLRFELRIAIWGRTMIWYLK